MEDKCPASSVGRQRKHWCCSTHRLLAACIRLLHLVQGLLISARGEYLAGVESRANERHSHRNQPLPHLVQRD